MSCALVKPPCIFLDQGYVEVSLGVQGDSRPGKRLLSVRSSYYLRTANPGALIPAASARSTELSYPAIYHGRNGDWEDVEIRLPGLEKLSPLIVRRLTPTEVAADWPPGLAKPHLNGVEAVESVYVLAGGRREASKLAELLSLLVTGVRRPRTGPVIQCYRP